TERLPLKLRRPPSAKELSAALGIETAEVLEILEAQHNRRPLSLDAPPTGGEDPDDSSGAEWIRRAGRRRRPGARRGDPARPLRRAGAGPRRWTPRSRRSAAAAARSRAGRSA